MRETRRNALRLKLDRELKFEFHGTRLNSDAGLLTGRERLILNFVTTEL